MASQIGQAYVQIIPSAKGIGASVASALTPSSKKAGASSGMAIASMMKKYIGAAAIGTVVVSVFRKAIQEGGKLQQSIGGIDTMFKKDSGTVQKYAANAFKTTGLSANAYMESATSFSASLINSLGGNTKKAAKLANTALVDMSDNANKMGTSMGSIQYAYQGFAKQNYTMLDNLKLGYGGTKSEMQRLLQDAQKLTGEKYDITNLSDVYNAIHAIQGKLGITGTTAKEAAHTLTGSASMMSAAWTNLLGDMTSGDDKKIQKDLSNLSYSLVTFAKNLIPMMGNILANAVKQLPKVASAGFTKMVDAASTIMTGKGGDKISSAIKTWAPKIAVAILKLAVGAAAVVGSLSLQIIANGMELVSDLLYGIGKKMKDVLKAGAKAIKNFLKGVLSYPARLVSAGFTVVVNFAKGISRGISTAVGFAKRLASAVVSAISRGIHGVVSIGLNIVKGIWKGISSGYGWIKARIKSWVGNVVDFLKKVFKIGSPSKLMADEIGQWIPKGIASGISGNVGSIKTAMSDAMNATSGFGRAYAMSAAVPAASGYQPATANSVVSGIGSIMAGQKTNQNIEIVLYADHSGAKLGEWVVKTYDDTKRRIG